MRVVWIASAFVLGLAAGAGVSGYFVETLRLDPEVGRIGIAFLFATLFAVLAEPLRGGLARLNSDLSAGVSNYSASEIISGILGLVVGLLVTYLLLSILLIPDATAEIFASGGPALAVAGLGGLLVIYLSVLTLVALDPMAAVLKSPRRRGGTPKILDTNVVLDGRVGAVLAAGFIEGPILVPESVLGEIHTLADSTEPGRRSLGRRGLESLKVLLEQNDSPVRVLEEDVRREGTIDEHLVALAETLSASLVTNDYNLNKVAGLRGVAILNLNELAIAVRPRVVAGEELSLALTRRGTEKGQAVGHLPDGTMVVVEEAQRLIGETVGVVVKSVLQTEAGQIVFTRLA